MIKDYRLVIFDWDGTLVDSQMQIITCVQSAYRQLELSPPANSAIRHIVGLSLEEAISRLNPELDYHTVDQLAEAYRDIAFSDKEHASDLFHGAKDCLAFIRQQDIHLAIATGKSRRGLNAAMDASGVQVYFDITRCADETRSKPHPLMLEEILIDLNLNASQAVMVGDTIYDIDMANSIGMDSIAVTYGMHDESLLAGSSPSHLINNIGELLSLVCPKPISTSAG